MRCMIEICGHPAPETLGLPREAVEEAQPLVEEQLPNSNDLDAATLPEASSAGPVNNTEVFDELPQYTAVDESSNPVDVNHLAMEGTVIENSDLDLPPPYTELPQILDTSLPTAMNEVPPSTDNGQHDDDLISLQSQDPVVAHQFPQNTLTFWKLLTFSTLYRQLRYLLSIMRINPYSKLFLLRIRFNSQQIWNLFKLTWLHPRYLVSSETIQICTTANTVAWVSICQVRILVIEVILGLT